MLTSITYNCDPDSLDTITPAEFALAFERAALKNFPDADIRLTFRAGKSGVIGYETDNSADAAVDDSWLRGEFVAIDERAFAECCFGK